MLYIFSLLFIIVKGLSFVIKKEVLYHLTEKNIIFLTIIIVLLILCKKTLKYKRIFFNITDHIIQYRFKSKEDFNYSLVILITTIIGYISIIIYLRIRSFSKPIDLHIIYTSLKELYLKMPKGILCYNLLILILIIYLFIIFTKLVKKRLNVHLTKIHFYFMCFNKYVKMHHYFKYHLSVDAIFIDTLTGCYDKVLDFVITLYLFHHCKNTIFRYGTVPEQLPRTKYYVWTVKEKQDYSAFKQKYNYFWNVMYKPIKVLFYNLHFFLLIITIVYDIIYNKCILQHAAWVLPFLFFYQIYIFLSQFVQDKILSDIYAEINTLYYQNIEYISDKTMILNGEIVERPNNEQVILEFVKYEAAEFYWTRVNDNN